MKLTMACGPYDRARALIEGTVVPEGIELEVVVGTRTKERQQRVVAGEFDVAEFYTGAYIADCVTRDLGLTAVPIFVKRMFRHSYVYVNRRRPVRPAELNGKRVGVQSWLTTTALWMRGILADDHGIDLSSITWVAESEDVGVAWSPPPWLDLEILPPGRDLQTALVEGDLDAVITTRLWAPEGHPDIGFMFADYAAAERDYYRRTGFFPIMHTLVVRDRILEEHPWVAMSLFNAWQESKRRCYEWLQWQRVHQTALWYRALWEEERAAGGADPYVWGFSAAKAELDQMLEYSFQQGLTPHRLRPEEMFHPSTLAT